MRALYKILATTVIIGACATPALADSATARASVVIIQPLRIEHSSPLEFGVVRGGVSSGEIEIAPHGRWRKTGGAVASPSPRHPASFRISGEPGREFRVETPEVIALGNGIVATAFQVVSENTADASGKLDSGGADTIHVGGRLFVPANAPAGRYSVELPIVVEYY